MKINTSQSPLPTGMQSKPAHWSRALVAVSCAALALFQSANAQSLTENFPVAGALTANGWAATNGAGTNPITASSPALTYPSLPTASPSNAVSLTTSGEDDSKTFSPANTSGSLYSSFLVNVTAAQATGDYFFAFGTTFTGRVFAKSSGAGYVFGISKLSTSGTTIVYDSTVRNFNTTYLVVLKHTRLTANATDDFASIWINPALGSAETSPTVFSTDAGADTTTLSTVVLRQGAATSAPTLRLGSILVGTTWASVTPTSGAASPMISTTGTPTAFSTVAGTASASQSFTANGTTLSADILVTAPANFEVSTDNTTFSNSVTLIQTGGTASGTIYAQITAAAPVGAVSGNISLTSAGATAQNVAVIGTVISALAPLVNATPTSLTGFSTSAGVVSATQTFSVSGTNLGTNDLTITAPTGYEVATTHSYGPTVTLTPSSGTVTSTAISVRISTAAAVGSPAGNVTVASSGATTVNVAVSGTVSAAVVINYISLTAAGSPYSQNFNGLGSATIANAFSSTIGLQSNLSSLPGTSSLDGWYGTKNDGTGIVASGLTAEAGSGSSGGIFSYGTGTAADRALGALASSSNIMTFGALVKNNSSGALTGLTFSFTSEFWRQSTAVQNILKFAYGKVDGVTITNNNFLTSTSATLFSSLDINGPPPVGSGNTSLDGNLAANQSAVTSITLPITLAAGEVAFIRWSDINDGGNDAGLAIDDLTITGENSSILIPTVSIPGGAYYTNQTVFVSNFASYVAGETLRYTLDGSDPTGTSTAYDNGAGIPVPIGAGTKTLKVAAFPTAGGRSNVSTTTYFLPLDVANLTALRTSPTGTTIYRVTGEVTFTASLPTRNTKFFQDAAAGIQIDDFNAVVTGTYSVGDNVANIIGTLSTFQGQRQFTPRVNFEPLASTGNTVTPVTKTLATLTDADQARLVSITSVAFSSAGAIFATAPSFTNINDGAAGVCQNLFGTNTATGLEITGSTIPVGPNTVTGVVQKTLVSAVQTITVAPRSMADIVYTGPPLITVTSNKSALTEGATGLSAEATVTITRTGSTAAALAVDLTQSTAGQLLVDFDDGLFYQTLPRTVSIAIGQSAVTVYVVAANDAVYTGTRNVTFSATSAGFISGTKVFTITDDEANTYANWIAGFNVGAETGPNDDYDKDGIANTLEDYMGSDPSVSNTGLTAVSGTATTLTFRHNRADSPATDVSASYEWSVDLVSWFPSGAGAGISVTIAPPTVITNGSPNDLVQVTATVTGGAATQLFARLKGVKAP